MATTSDGLWPGSPPSHHSFESDFSDAAHGGHHHAHDWTQNRMTPMATPEAVRVNGLDVNGHDVNGLEKDTDTAEMEEEEAFVREASGTDRRELYLKRDRQEHRFRRRGASAPKQHHRDDLATGRRIPRIHWAPLRLPFQRRLQTLVVLLHTLSVALLVSSFFFLCAIPITWPLLLPYLVYVLLSRAHVSGKLTYRSHFLRSLPHWSLFAAYYPARLHRSEPLPPTRKYIFGYHPHGIISHGAFAAFVTEALGFSRLFPGITNTLLTLDSNFRLPLYREYLLALGIASVSRESCENILSRGGPNGEGMGRAITIVVGGAAEALNARPRTLRLVLKRRKGFVKLAIRTGADLVPVLCFGENDLYDQLCSTSHPLIHKAQMLLKRSLGFTLPLFHARGVFNYDVGLMPYRRPLNIVVGRPVKVARQARPEDGYVDQIHAEYVQELQRMWDEWKDVLAQDRIEEMSIPE
ncbi:MAG: diacylglycerol O-acyltransferase 1 [Lichina confinis]|nr:MAG: diacylglycerol O-acyltransferase 1 [Lichina confinis]